MAHTVKMADSHRLLKTKNAAIRKFGRRCLVEDAPAARLPDIRDHHAELIFSTDLVSIYASVRKGQTREICQDTVAVLVDRRFTLIGVFDGYSGGGEIFSASLADHVLSSCAGNKGSLLEDPDAGRLLERALGGMLEGRSFSQNGGTTAAVALVLPDRSYSVCNVGDSASYLIRGSRSRRLFGHGYMARSFDVGRLGVKPYVFFTRHNDIQFAVTSDGIRSFSNGSFDPVAPEVRSGVLAPGTGILLASDGLSNNLGFTLDRHGHIKDVSGCADLSSIIGKLGNAPSAGKAIMKAVEERAGRSRECWSRAMEGEDGITLLPSNDDVSFVLLSPYPSY
jgi:serine/threonine protein phosphatase PrpC